MRDFKKISKLDSLSDAISEFAKKKRENVEPSQPAGAREWLKETRDWDRHGRGYIRKSDGRLELLDDTLEAYAHEQTAAKDAELKTATQRIAELEEFWHDKNEQWQAAERERDSLREALKKIKAKSENSLGLRVMVEINELTDAALKAGKE